MMHRTARTAVTRTVLRLCGGLLATVALLALPETASAKRAIVGRTMPTAWIGRSPMDLINGQTFFQDMGFDEPNILDGMSPAYKWSGVISTQVNILHVPNLAYYFVGCLTLGSTIHDCNAGNIVGYLVVMNIKGNLLATSEVPGLNDQRRYYRYYGDDQVWHQTPTYLQFPDFRGNAPMGAGALAAIVDAHYFEMLPPMPAHTSPGRNREEAPPRPLPKSQHEQCEDWAAKHHAPTSTCDDHGID